MKKFLSVIFCIAMLLSICSMGFTASAEEYQVGDIIEFGNYPQSQVTDESLIAELNKDTSEWISYGYYAGPSDSDSYGEIGPTETSDCMSYKDVAISGSEYRGVKIDDYRPYLSNFPSGDINATAQIENKYYEGEVYWFKYEPLKWRVLDPSSGLVMCDSIIDSQPFNNVIVEKDDDLYLGPDCIYYANDYSVCHLREWLNDEFYNAAFSEKQALNILTTTVDNSSENSDYDISETNDKVFLLSFSEVTNSSYGFSTDDGSDSARHANFTDYALSQGMGQINGGPYWWLRSPQDGSEAAIQVDSDGEVNACTGNFIHCTGGGVLPAITLKSIKNDTSIDGIGGSKATSDNADKNVMESDKNVGATSDKNTTKSDKNTEENSENNTVLIIGIAGGALVLILIAVVIILAVKLKKGKNNGPKDGGNNPPTNIPPQNNFAPQQNQPYQQVPQQNFRQYAPDQAYPQAPQQMNYQAVPQQPIQAAPVQTAPVQAPAPQQSAPTQSPISVVPLNKPGACRKCCSYVPEIYRLTLTKGGKVSEAELCPDCVNKFIRAYNSKQ